MKSELYAYRYLRCVRNTFVIYNIRFVQTHVQVHTHQRINGLKKDDKAEQIAWIIFCYNDKTRFHRIVSGMRTKMLEILSGTPLVYAIWHYATINFLK